MVRAEAALAALESSLQDWERRGVPPLAAQGLAERDERPREHGMRRADRLLPRGRRAPLQRLGQFEIAEVRRDASQVVERVPDL